MRTLIEAPRRCGTRKPGGFYLVSESGSEGILSPLTLIDPPVLTTQKFHRGYTLVNGDSILNREPESEWPMGATKTRLEKTSWAVEHFGMPLEKRAGFGVCAKARTEEECYSAILEKVRGSPTIFAVIKDIGLAGLNHLVPLTYSRLISHARDYVDGDAIALVELAADAHRLLTESSKSSKIKPYVIRLLAALGLIEDAIALAKE